jgi:hypothetical protein
MGMEITTEQQNFVRIDYNTVINLRYVLSIELAVKEGARKPGQERSEHAVAIVTVRGEDGKVKTYMAHDIYAEFLLALVDGVPPFGEEKLNAEGREDLLARAKQGNVKVIAA